MHFAVDEEIIADELERGKVYPIKFAHILEEFYFSHYIQYRRRCKVFFYYFSLTTENQMKTELFNSLTRSRRGKKLSNTTCQTEIIESRTKRGLASHGHKR